MPYATEEGLFIFAEGVNAAPFACPQGLEALVLRAVTKRPSKKKLPKGPQKKKTAKRPSKKKKLPSTGLAEHGSRCSLDEIPQPGIEVKKRPLEGDSGKESPRV